MNSVVEPYSSNVCISKCNNVRNSTINPQSTHSFGTDFDALCPEQLWPRVDDNAAVVLSRAKPTNEDPKPKTDTDIDLESKVTTGSDPNPDGTSELSPKMKPDSTPKSAPPQKSAADVEYERLCYEHMLLITRAPDPEEDDSMSSEESMDGVGSRSKSPVTRMDEGGAVRGERKSKSKAIAYLSSDADVTASAGAPMGTVCRMPCNQT